MQEYKEIYKYKQYNGYSQVKKKRLESLAGGWKERTLNGLSMIHASAAHL